MRYVSMIIMTVSLAMGSVVPVSALEHDHQPWNEVRVGRMMAIHRVDRRECARAGIPYASCGKLAIDDAINKLAEAVDILGCRSIDGDQQPTLVKHEPLTEFDPGALVVAELKDVYCDASPRQQLISVSPVRFKNLCSRLSWKCDVVWISDGDPEVLYMNRLSDIPLLTKVR